MKPEWNRLRQQLIDEARRALRADSFQARNHVHAASVAREGEELAAAAGLTDSGPRDIFSAAAAEAGAAFEPAFTPSGAKLPDRQTEYDSAVSVAGAVAFRHLAGWQPDAGKVLARARIADLAALFAGSFSADAVPTEPELVAAIRRLVPKNDFFYSELERALPVRTPEEKPLSDRERDVLALALRLAHATWKAGQVHRAAWEGSENRIDPDQRTPFLPYDAYLCRKYDKAGFAAVVFEAYKDLLELDKAEKASR